MKVLIVKTSSLGDIIHTLPALTDAKKAIPEINFDWVVEEAFAEIPTWHEAVRSVIPIAWRRLRKNPIKAICSQEISLFLKGLRSENYDYIIDAQGLIKSAIITKIAKGTSYGYDKNSIREPIASIFYQNKFAISKDQHAITRIRQLFAQALKYELPITPPNYNIKIPPAQKNIEKYMIFFHGTSNDKKCWAEKKWLDLAELVTKNGFVIYLPWGNNTELARAKRISQNNQQIKILPKSNLSTIATMIQNAKMVISIDTGLGHLAAALGIPTISLYGPTNPKLIGTIGNNQTHMINFEQLEAMDVWKRIMELLQSKTN